MHSFDFKYAQYNYPIFAQGMSCKYILEVLKMSHYRIENMVIVSQAYILHGVEKTMSLS